MKYVKKISILLIALFAILLIPNTKVSAFELTANPTGICVSYYDDIDSRGFAWQTATNVENSYVKIVKDNGNVNWNDAEVINATYVDAYGFRNHKAYKTDMEPGKYYYKVGSAKGESEVGSFTIDNSNDNKVSFTYLTDSQQSSPEGFEFWNKTLTAAVKHNPDFITFAGDLVDNNHAAWGEDYSLMRPEEYSYAFDAAKDVLMNYAFMPASGNHEAAGYAHVNHSTINYAGALETGGYYSFDYENLHVTVIESNSLSRSNQAEIDAQLAWLENDLKNAKTTWKVVVIHNGPYSTGDHTLDGETVKLRNLLPPIFAKYKVDLVMQGHDHVYTRTMPYLYGLNSDGDYENGKVANRNEKLVLEDGILWSMEPDGTYYITINFAGTKHYPPKDYDTSRIFPAKSPVNGKIMSQHITNRMFAHVEIDGDSLLLKSYISYDDGTEELYDYIAIKKNTYQDAIEAIDKLPNEVTIDNSYELKEAKELVDNLSDRALAYVPQTSLDKLDNLLQTYNLNDAVKAYAAVLAIAKLDTTNYDEEFWVNYQEANDLYYNLNASQMDMVYNKQILSNLKVSLEVYRDEKIQQYLLESVQNLIDGIQSASDKEKARVVAKIAYDALSTELQSKITNTEILNQSFVNEVATEEGCGGAIFGSLVTVLLLGCATIVIKRRRGEYDE